MRKRRAACGPALGLGPALALGAPLALGAALAIAPALAAAAPAAAPQDEPVRLSIEVAAVVAAHAAIPVSVTLDADRGALSARSGPLRLRVRYAAAACSGTFAGTPGAVALDERIPDPAAAGTYHAALDGAAEVAGLGAYNVCAYLEEEGTDRLFAQSSDARFQATAACTDASSAVQRGDSQLGAARRKLAHAKRSRRAAIRRRIAQLVAQQRAAQRSQRTACR